MSNSTAKLKIWTAVSVVIGCVIGSGIFVKPGRVLLAAGGSNAALMAWLLGGVISLAGGLTVAEIASRISRSGGIYTYVEELFGDTIGFMCGWVQSLIYGPALMSALALYFASLLTQFVGMDDQLIRPIALITLFLLASVNALSTTYGAFIQNTTTFIKLIPIATIGVAGLFMGDAQIFNMSVPSTGASAGMGAAILATLWAYDGWIQVSNLSGEIENPSKNLPRAIIFGLLGVMVSYLLINMSLFHVVEVSKIAELNERTAAVAAESLFGQWGGKALSLGILISIFGCLNGNILSMVRIPYAMAIRGAFPFHKTFGKLHPSFATPVNSIILKAIIAAIMILLLNPDRITDIAMFIMYLFYGAVFFGIFILRKRSGRPEKDAYSVPFYPVVPLIAGFGSLYICYSMFAQQPLDALVSIGIALTGLPVYALIKKNRPT